MARASTRATSNRPLRPLAEYAQLVFVDLRGQDRSGGAPAESWTLEQMADDVAALCAALGIERPRVLGHSAGGFVALQLALRHPELPAGLILCHTAPTLASLPNPDPPRGPAERGGAAAGAAAARLFAGDFVPEVLEAFDRLVLPLYAAPGHEDVAARLMALSALTADIARHFFQHLAGLRRASAARRDRRPSARHRGSPRLGLPPHRRTSHRRRHPRARDSSSCRTPGTSASRRPPSPSCGPCESTSRP